MKELKEYIRAQIISNLQYDFSIIGEMVDCDSMWVEEEPNGLTVCFEKTEPNISISKLTITLDEVQ